MNSELCQLCEDDTTSGHAAPLGEGWMCDSCLSAYGHRAPCEVLEALTEVLSDAAQSVAAQTGADGANERAIQLARCVLQSPALTARLQILRALR